MYSTLTTPPPPEESHGNALLHRQLVLYLGTPLSILGILANMLVIAVWRRINRTREGTSRSAPVHMIWLAVVSSVLLLSFFLTEVLPEMKRALMCDIHFLRYYCYVGYPFHRMICLASVWLMIGTTVNRLVAMLFPHLAHTYNNLRTTKVTIAVTLVLSFAVSVPYFFTKRPHLRKNTWQIITTPYGHSDTQQLFDIWGHCVAFIAAPWLFICTCNVFLLRTILFKTRIQKHKKRGNRQTEHKTTITVLVLTTVWLVLLLFQSIGTCLWKFQYAADDPDTRFKVSSVYTVACLGVMINAAVGFFVYCASSGVFRRELKKIFGCGTTGVQEYTQFSNTDNKRKRQGNVINGDVGVDYSRYPDAEEEEDEEDDDEEEAVEGEVARVENDEYQHAVA